MQIETIVKRNSHSTLIGELDEYSAEQARARQAL